MDNVLVWSLLSTVAGLMVFLLLTRWRTGIIILFMWLYLEDVVRRLMPGQPPEVKLVTDALVLLSYLSFLAAAIVQRPAVAPASPRPFLTAFGVFLGMCVIAALNPGSPGIAFILLGLRSYVWYVPLVFLGSCMFKDDAGVTRFCRTLVYTAIPLAVLAIFQFIFSESDLPLLRPLAGGHRYHSFDLLEGPGMPLVSSVFGSATRYARFSLLLFLLGLALWASGAAGSKRPFLVLATAAAAVGVLVSGSRTATYLLPVAFVAFVGALSWGGTVRLRSRPGARALVLGIAGLVALVGTLAAFPTMKLWLVESIPEVQKRLLSWAPGDIVSGIQRGGLFGVGLGTASQGIQYVPGGQEWRDRQFTLGEGKWLESGVSKLIFELGLLGLVSFYAFIGETFRACRRASVGESDRFRRGVASATAVYLGCLVIWFSFVHHQGFGDATTLIPLWFFIGVTLRRRAGWGIGEHTRSARR